MPKRRRFRKQERWEVWDAHIGENNIEGPCAACGRPIHYRDFVVGHNIALPKGGLDTIANMPPICRRCDEGMGTDSIDEYRHRLRGPATASPDKWALPDGSTPTTKPAQVAELKAEWDQAGDRLQHLREELGLIARVLVPGKPIEMPKRVLTEQALAELEEAESERDDAEDRYREAVGMPPKQRHTT